MNALPVLVGLALLAAAPTAEAACRTSKDDAEQVEAAVRGFYAALASDDEAGAARIATPDFYAYDVGRRFDSAAELASTIKQTHARGVVLEWNLGPVDVHVRCDSAWAAWENDGRVGPKDALQPMHWLESAVLVRDGARWRIRFLHSTRVPPSR